MGGKLQGAAEGKGAASCLELPCSVGREVEVEEIGQENVETAMHKMKRQGDSGRLSAASDVSRWLERWESSGQEGY